MKTILSSALVFLLLVCQSVFAQTFSVEDSSTDTIPAVVYFGDAILGPALPTPVTVLGSAGLTPVLPVEVDGFTYGRHFNINPQNPFAVGPVDFSVDLPSTGAVGTGVSAEAMAAPGEANYDVFRTAIPGTNFQIHDGNGAGPGGTVSPLGVAEPQGPFFHPFVPGVDGYDSRSAPGPDIYWSWDPAFLAPPPTGVSASGSDVIFSPSTPGFVAALSSVVYAPAGALGLDMSLLGADNLDALEVFDTGSIGVFDGTDLILFSLDRTSASLGDAASPFFGFSPADIFFATAGGGFGGVAIAAPTLGLTGNDNVTAISVVPEPGAILILIGALGVAGLTRRKRA